MSSNHPNKQHRTYRFFAVHCIQPQLSVLLRKCLECEWCRPANTQNFLSILCSMHAKMSGQDSKLFSHCSTVEKFLLLASISLTAKLTKPSFSMTDFNHAQVVDVNVLLCPKCHMTPQRYDCDAIKYSAITPVGTKSTNRYKM